MKFKSAIPWLQDRCFESMEDIHELNAIARKYSELSREEAAKFKAILEHEMPRDLQGVDYLLSVLDEYEFDNAIIYPSDLNIISLTLPNSHFISTLLSSLSTLIPLSNA